MTQLHDAARYYAKLGWPVYPKHGIVDGECTCSNADCSHPGKHPRVKGGAHAGTTDLGQIDAWWRRWPQANVGVTTGAAGNLLVVDTDGPDGEVALAELGELPRTCTVKTGRGRHRYFTTTRPVKSRTAIRAQLDILSRAHSATAPPSRHASGNDYAWEVAPWDTPPAPAPAWLEELIDDRVDDPPTPPQDASTDDVHINAYVTAALDAECARVLGAGKGGRNRTLNRAAFAVGQLVAGAGLSEAVAMQRLEVAAAECGLTSHEARQTITSGLAGGKKKPRVVPAGDRPKPKEKRKTVERRKPTRDWRDLLIYSPATQTRPEMVAANVANVITILTQSPQWKDVVAHDDFAMQLAVRKAPPWDKLDAPSAAHKTGAQWTDADSARFHSWLERSFGVRFSAEAVQMGLLAAAHKQSWHPVNAYLNAMEWDGVARVDSWLSVYASAPPDEYAQLAGRWWLISAVARVFRPGVKADHVLILEGRQGIGKSTLLATLAGAWFSDTPLDLSSKDAVQALRGRWIIELAELDSLSRAAASRAKAFFSSPIDHVRPPYGRYEIEQKRQCVFAGTVNPEGGYLTDATGARRYWPVACHGVDMAAMVRDRDQLWAEAAALYHAGESWWPTTAEHRALFATEADGRRETDSWEETLSAWVERKMSGSTYTAATLLADGIGMPPERVTRAAQMRLSSVLRAMGWSKERSTVDGRRAWKWAAPRKETKEDKERPLPF